jgi:hypothetical protein
MFTNNHFPVIKKIWTTKKPDFKQQTYQCMTG